MSYLSKVLIPEWKSALKMASVQVSLVFGAIAFTWTTLPPEFQKMALDSLGISGSGVLALIGFVGFIWARLAAQPKIGFNEKVPFFEALKSYLSVQLATIFSAGTAVWLVLPVEDQQAIMALVGPKISGSIGAAAFAMLVLARLKAQGTPAVAQAEPEDVTDQSGEPPKA